MSTRLPNRTTTVSNGHYSATHRGQPNRFTIGHGRVVQPPAQPAYPPPGYPRSTFVDTKQRAEGSPMPMPVLSVFPSPDPSSPTPTSTLSLAASPVATTTAAASSSVVVGSGVEGVASPLSSSFLPTPAVVCSGGGVGVQDTGTGPSVVYIDVDTEDKRVLGEIRSKYDQVITKAENDALVAAGTASATVTLSAADKVTGVVAQPQLIWKSSTAAELIADVLSLCKRDGKTDVIRSREERDAMAEKIIRMYALERKLGEVRREATTDPAAILGVLSSVAAFTTLDEAIESGKMDLSAPVPALVVPSKGNKKAMTDNTTTPKKSKGSFFSCGSAQND